MANKVDLGQLVNNVVAGFAAGIAVAMVLGIYQGVTDRIERKEQISYVRDLIADTNRSIESAKENSLDLGFRFSLYNKLLWDLTDFFQRP